MNFLGVFFPSHRNCVLSVAWHRFSNEWTADLVDLGEWQVLCGIEGHGLQSIRFADQILRQTSLGVPWINVDAIGGEQLMEPLKQGVTLDVRSQPTLLTDPKDNVRSLRCCSHSTIYDADVSWLSQSKSDVFH